MSRFSSRKLKWTVWWETHVFVLNSVGYVARFDLDATNKTGYSYLATWQLGRNFATNANVMEKGWFLSSEWTIVITSDHTCMFLGKSWYLLNLNLLGISEGNHVFNGIRNLEKTWLVSYWESGPSGLGKHQTLEGHSIYSVSWFVHRDQCLTVFLWKP